jgi:branched-chain amino acid transport system ATP-binding protein
MNALETNALCKSFGGLKAVSELDLSLGQGEILGLIGPNGAGKTTVFNCLCRFLPTDSGQTIFYGRDITGLKPHVVSQLGLARTFQIVRPFLTISVLENVMVGGLVKEKSVKKARAQSMSILELVGLEDVKNRPASELPLPRRKRLEMARALATKPKVLLLDEVMSGLTPTEVDDLIELIKKINGQGISILLIEHVMRGVMALSEKVVVINYGQKIAEGRPEEIVENPQVIEAYLGREFRNA